MGTSNTDMEDKYPGGSPPVMQQPQPGPYGQGQPYGGQAPYGGQPPPYGGQAPYDGQGGAMMAPPMAPAGCPPGLQYLSMVDQLVVKQKVEILEAFPLNRPLRCQCCLCFCCLQEIEVTSPPGT